MDERIPVVGVDYPRTHQQLVAWFCPEADCLEYLPRLRSPGSRIRPASATAPRTPRSPPRGRTTPPAADACAGSPPPPPESARPYSKSTGLKQIPNTPVRYRDETEKSTKSGQCGRPWPTTNTARGQRRTRDQQGASGLGAGSLDDQHRHPRVGPGRVLLAALPDRRPAGTDVHRGVVGPGDSAGTVQDVEDLLAAGGMAWQRRPSLEHSDVDPNTLRRGSLGQPGHPDAGDPVEGSPLHPLHLHGLTLRRVREKAPAQPHSRRSHSNDVMPWASWKFRRLAMPGGGGCTDPCTKNPVTPASTARTASRSAPAAFGCAQKISWGSPPSCMATLGSIASRSHHGAPSRQVCG